MDEFLPLLLEHAGSGVEILPTDNASVLATLRVLAEAKQEPVSGKPGQITVIFSVICKHLNRR